MEIVIHDVLNDQVIVRNMTNDEKLALENTQAQIAQDLEAEAAKEVARQALLDKLGITADEAKLLLGA